MIVPHYYEGPHMLHKNVMPDRAYYIPASAKMDCLVEERERSDRIRMLNGEWCFRYYNSIHDLTEPFFENGYDLTGFDTVPGPASCPLRQRSGGTGNFRSCPASASAGGPIPLHGGGFHLRNPDHPRKHVTVPHSLKRRNHKR